MNMINQWKKKRFGNLTKSYNFPITPQQDARYEHKNLDLVI